jgi:hypothetical protein
MKIRNLALTVVLCLWGLSLAVAADNPFLGTWKLNEAKSHIPSGAAKITSAVYTPAANDMVTVTTDGVDAQGNPIHTVWTGKFDGKPYPVTGSSEVDNRTMEARGLRTLIATNLQGVKPISKGKIEISADGKSRTLDLAGTTADGKPYKATYFYDKQ